MENFKELSNPGVVKSLFLQVVDVTLSFVGLVRKQKAVEASTIIHLFYTAEVCKWAKKDFGANANQNHLRETEAWHRDEIKKLLDVPGFAKVEILND